jgi:L-ascorbate metabolism protein UlaG (beta-lactamase superfamily)
VTITGGDAEVTRDLGCWGWLLEFEDGTRVYHTGDTDLFGDMALVKDRWAPTITVLPIGGHYTMGPADAGRAVDLIGAEVAIPVHYATFPALAGTPAQLRVATDAQVVALEPGETWEA